ncbi:GNAT family N-acetyltransferase [Streptomyces jumonjinensis]|uniref:GNAT family N-acetyltransferase n=1 Tax=Streptomyces jumonjinensis TaxID=1945 RepID=UPI0037978468
MSAPLITDRLRFRPLTDSDLGHLFDLNNDPEVMRFLNGGRPTTLEEVRANSLPRLTRHYPCIGGPGFWAADDRATGVFAGWFELRPVAADSAAVVELGYRLNRTAWGRGLATEGAVALIDRAFAGLGVETVTANTMSVNARSRRVMEKAGLRHLRTFFDDWPDRIEGSELGEVEYAMTRDEWHRARAAVNRSRSHD